MTDSSIEVSRKRALRWLLALVLVLLIVIAAAGLLVAIRWPFSQAKTKTSIEDALHATITMARFEEVYFPHPGCIIHGFTSTQPDANDETQRIARADKITIRAGHLDFFLRPVISIASRSTV